MLYFVSLLIATESLFLLRMSCFGICAYLSTKFIFEMNFDARNVSTSICTIHRWINFLLANIFIRNMLVVLGIVRYFEQAKINRVRHLLKCVRNELYFVLAILDGERLSTLSNKEMKFSRHIQWTKKKYSINLIVWTSSRLTSALAALQTI